MSLWPKNFCLSFRALRRRNIYLCFTGGGGRRTLGGGGRDTCMKKITEGGACCSLETWFAFLTSRCVRNRDNGHVESYSVNECERNMLTIKNNFLSKTGYQIGSRPILTLQHLSLAFMTLNLKHVDSGVSIISEIAVCPNQSSHHLSENLEKVCGDGGKF